MCGKVYYRALVNAVTNLWVV